jgi:probable rRNA maturation factor
MSVEIRTHPRFSSRIPRTRLARIVARALRAERVRADVTLYITSNSEIRKLNRRFHATDSATDVLSFSAPFSTQDKQPFLGDIVISYERAKTQAKAVGWRIGDELELLTVHGVLHLLGYDDLTPRRRAKMWARQAEILKREIRG